MITALSWKNIWRSKRRSLVVIGAITTGVWALIFIIAFYNSFNVAFLKNAIEHEYSHIQIHNPQYLKDANLSYSIDDAEKLIQMGESLPQVQAYSGRLLVDAMAASARNNAGVKVYGIDPGQEAATTQLDSQLVEGTYFEQVSRNPILISSKLAEKLSIKIRSKVVLTFQDADRNITAASFRVEGIFESKSPRINEGVFYVRQDDLARLTRQQNPHEIAYLLESEEQVPLVKEKLSYATENEVRSFREIAPTFDLMKQSSSATKQVITVIIMLALLFGIINTMLMAVLERTHEIGMLRSIGMHRWKVFVMIMVETILLSVIAGPLGVVLGFVTVSITGNRGLDMTAYADAISDFGLDTVFYPEIASATYIVLMVVVVFTALLGSIYPALKAIKINPLEAIRYH
jgi:ABC-type lipoprotein release transport system permease subunit